jgi:hypothetical protein
MGTNSRRKEDASVETAYGFEMDFIIMAERRSPWPPPSVEITREDRHSQRGSETHRKVGG